MADILEGQLEECADVPLGHQVALDGVPGAVAGLVLHVVLADCVGVGLVPGVDVAGKEDDFGGGVGFEELVGEVDAGRVCYGLRGGG